ncbi:MAG: hypothetical protein Q9173_000484 [Seirophora scorigena]
MYLRSVTCVLYLVAFVIAAPTTPPECSFSHRVYNLAVAGTCHLAPRLRTWVEIPDTPTGAVETVSVEVCTGKSFTGHCQHLKGLRDNCYNLPKGFNLNVTSIDPSADTVCTLYKELDCWEGYPIPLGGIVNPGIRNLEDRQFNKAAQSYLCT